MPRTPYEVLGVAPDATPQQIRKAYRKIALDSHPDRNPGDAEAEERFREATAAYQLLSDPEARAAYDADPSTYNAQEDGESADPEDALADALEIARGVIETFAPENRIAPAISLLDNGAKFWRKYGPKIPW